MKRSPVAKRYAKALFESALEDELLEKIEKDFENLANHYDENDEFRSLLDSPVVANKIKQSVVDKLFKTHLNALTYRFVSLLIQKNREANLPQIIDGFRKLLDAHRGVLRGNVYSAVPLSKKQSTNLKKQLDKTTGKNVLFEQFVDEDLLGGVVVRIEDTVYDTSLRNQLSKLKQTLVEA